MHNEKYLTCIDFPQFFLNSIGAKLSWIIFQTWYILNLKRLYVILLFWICLKTALSPCITRARGNPANTNGVNQANRTTTDTATSMSTAASRIQDIYYAELKSHNQHGRSYQQTTFPIQSPQSLPQCEFIGILTQPPLISSVSASRSTPEDILGWRFRSFSHRGRCSLKSQCGYKRGLHYGIVWSLLFWNLAIPRTDMTITLRLTNFT